MKKELDIWQFVRIMVEAEENPNGKKLLDAWGDIWTDVDTTLSNLANQDIEQYAQTMMDNQIILDDITRLQADTVMEMASSVIERLGDVLEKTEENDPIAQDIAFEIQGLEQVVDEFSNEK